MDFKRMRKNIKQNKYRTLDEMEADMTLLCKNAQVYNMEGSLVCIVIGKYNTNLSGYHLSTEVLYGYCRK